MGHPGSRVCGGVVAEYIASAGTTIAEPAGRWTAQNISPAKGNLAFPVEDDLGTGVNAWQIADQSAIATNPAYVASLTPAEISLATGSGWRFAMNGRYVFDFGDAANLGLSAFVAGRAFELRLDLTNQGDLQATFVDETPRVHTLTTGGLGPVAYHDFELRYDPLTALTAFRLDGLQIDAWDGTPTLFLDSVQWGNGPGSTRGIMNYHEVVFEVGPFVSAKPGDYDGDKDVDGNDFLIWQQNLGSTTTLAADGNKDGVVNAPDLALWRSNFGESLIPGDYDRDQDVDGNDFLVWQRSLGSMSSLAADGNANGVIDAADLVIWRNGFGGPVKPGDYDGDGDTDGGDFLVWQRTLGSTSVLSADGSRNGIIDAADLAVWRTHFGDSLASAEPLTIAAPEPNSVILIITGLASRLIWRFRKPEAVQDLRISALL